MEFDRVIAKRHSVRKFKSKKPNWRDILKAVNAANEIPLAGNITTLRFILVDNLKIIQELADACQQNFVGDAHYIVVVCSDNKQIKRAYDERGARYSRQQAGAAIENFLLKITDMGLASCWVGAFSDKIVKRILRIPEDVDVEAILPVGYEMGKQIRKRKKPSLNAVLFFNKYGEKYMRQEKRPDAF